jgi:hypothetical protein
VTGLFIERTNADGSYSIVWGPRDCELAEALAVLDAMQDTRRLELWSRAWAKASQGFAPIAWRIPSCAGAPISASPSLGARRDSVARRFTSSSPKGVSITGAPRGSVSQLCPGLIPDARCSVVAAPLHVELARPRASGRQTGTFSRVYPAVPRLGPEQGRHRTRLGP